MIAIFLKLSNLVKYDINIPILLLVQKCENRDSHFVQDLGAIIFCLQLYLVCWFVVLNLKDGFYCISPSPESQKLFVFEWDDPKTSKK